MSDVQSSTSDGLDYIDKNEIKNEEHDKQQQPTEIVVMDDSGVDNEIMIDDTNKVFEPSNGSFKILKDLSMIDEDCFHGYAEGRIGRYYVVSTGFFKSSKKILVLYEDWFVLRHVFKFVFLSPLIYRCNF